MEPKLYHTLNLGDFFIYNGKTYQKIKPVKKSCCTVLYNCTNPSNSAERVVVPDSAMVQPVEATQENVQAARSQSLTTDEYKIAHRLRLFQVPNGARIRVISGNIEKVDETMIFRKDFSAGPGLIYNESNGIAMRIPTMSWVMTVPEQSTIDAAPDVVQKEDFEIDGT